MQNTSRIQANTSTIIRRKNNLKYNQSCSRYTKIARQDASKNHPKTIRNQPKRPQRPSGHSKRENECQLTPKRCSKRLPNGSQMASKTIIFRCTFLAWFLKQFVLFFSSILTSFWLPFPIKKQYKIYVYFPSFLEVQVIYFST